MKRHLLPCLAILLCFSACIPETIPAYYLSPLDANTHPYHSIPLRSDSIKSAWYSSGGFVVGGANKNFNDNLYAFQGGIHRSQNFGLLQAYYGAGLSLGSYQVADYERIKYSGYPASPMIDTVYLINGGHNFFGAYGFNGGLNIAIPSPRGCGEFRIGVETGIYHEFGDYLRFRKSLADSAADIMATGAWTKTIGGYVEFLAKKRRLGTEFGFRFSGGGSFISPDNYRGDERINGPFYFTANMHLTKKKVTAFFQLNAGAYSGTFQTGINYKLGKLAR